VSFTTDDGLIGVRGLYNFGQDFNESYQGMLRESRSEVNAEETVLLDNPDSSFIELEQESGESVTGLQKSEDPLLVQAPTLAMEADQGYSDKLQDPTEEWAGPSERIRGYWSAGAEVYYSATEKLGGGKSSGYFSIF